MINIKRSVAFLLAVIIMMTTLPANASALTKDELNSGGCFILHCNGVGIGADIVSAVGGLCAVTIPESPANASENAKWIYNENGNLINGERYLCAAGSVLQVSPSYEYAITASQNEDNVNFYSGENEIFIGYDSENNAFVIVDDEASACDFSIYECVEYVSVQSITLNETSAELYVGNNLTLDATVLPYDATDRTVYWQSSDVSVATVNNGVVTAESEGNAQIYATTNDGGFVAKCDITVKSEYFTVRFYDYNKQVIKEQSVKKGEGATAPDSISQDGYTFLGWSVSDFSCVMSNMDIYSLWNTTVFTISFELFGGSCPDLPNKYTIETGDISLPAPSKKGYDFNGWFDNSSFSGESVTKIKKGSFGNKTFYASYIPEIYSISYELNGGSFTNTVISSYTIESPRIYLDIPVKRGYNFIGWYETPDFSDVPIICIESGSLGDRSFYAKYSPIKYTITYNCNGGNIAGTYPKEYTVQSEAITLPVPTRTGYSFAGWFSFSDFSGDRVYTLTNGSSGNKTYYAKWSIIEYSIAFKLLGGTPNGALPSKYTVDSETIILPDAERVGYVFSGWYLSSDYSSARVYEISNGSYGNKTFYAKWAVLQYAIVFHANGGIVPDDAPVGYNIESERITLPTSTRLAYDFVGWHDNAALSGKVIPSIDKGSYGDKHFYAEWSPVEYTITYNLNGGEFDVPAITKYTIESKTVCIVGASRAGYRFVGWYDNADFSGEIVTIILAGSYGNRTLYASWEPIVYTISYVANGGSIAVNSPTSYTIESENITLQEPQRVGYTFMGWYKNEDLSGNRIYLVQKGSLGNLMLYAAWKAVVYEITYYANDGSIVGDAVHTYTIESDDIDLPSAMKIGYEFKGWYDNSSLSGTVISMIDSGSVGNRAFYAAYSPITYLINYVLGGGTLYDGAVSSFNIETNTFALPTPTRTGYSFLGFYIAQDYSGSVIAQINKGTVGDITLYAAWQTKEYSITYYVYDGTMPNDDIPYSYNIESDTITLPRPTMTGHVFVGWYDNESFSGVAIREIASGSYGNKTFYANWRRLRYSVKFFDWDGETLLSSQYVEYGDAATAPDTVPMHYGYYFNGWSEDYLYVTSNLNCIALYELNVYDVAFVDLDYTIIEVQKVKHGCAAVAPEAPLHDDCVFVFWSCDFDNVVSDMTVVAVYRTTVVTPKPSSGQRFLIDTQMEENEDYLFAVNSEEGVFALTSLSRYEESGLWGMEITITNKTIVPADSSASIFDSVFHSDGDNDTGYSLTAESSGEKLSCESGEFIMCGIGRQHDTFSYVYRNDAWRLYDNTKDRYLKFNSAGGYFEPSGLDEASEIVLYKRINIPDYTLTETPYVGRTYTIVAQRPDGSAFVLTADRETGTLYGTPVDVVEGKLYFNDNIDEKTVAFRAVFGENAKGISYRSALLQKYLAAEMGDVVMSDNAEYYWKYAQNSGSGNNTLTEVNSNLCMFCSASGNFSAENSITHSKILLFERKVPDGKVGDANLDGLINTGDAVMLLRYSAGAMTFYDEQLRLGDANGDGLVNTGDAVAVLRYTVGLTDWLG